MADTLEKICGDELQTAKNVLSCAKEVQLQPVAVVVFPKDSVIAASGDVPTPAELQTAITAGLAMVIKIGAGTLPESTPIIMAADDSQDLLPEKISESQQLTGFVTNLNNNFEKALALLNLNHQNVQFGWIGKEGRYHNGKEGFLGSLGIFAPSLSGVKTLQKKITVDFDIVQTQYTHYSDIDRDYLTLENVDMIGTYTVANETGTSGDAIEDVSYGKVTGWGKDDYPTLFAEVTLAGEITYFASDALRTAGAEWLFVVDTNVSEAVTNGNTVGVTISGEINLVNVAITLNDKFTVTYS
jgi:hypothetical protein